MSQNPLKDKTNPSLNYISTYKLPMKTAREKEKVTNSNTKLPPLSIPLGINSHNHPIILAKPKFPNSLHLNSSYNKLNQNNAQKHEYEKEEGEEEYNDFLNKKNKNISGATSSSNNNTMKTNQYTGSSLHLPSNNQMKTNSELKELKKNIGIEINNEINNYNKIVKDLDSIIDQAHFPSSLKSNRSNFFDSNLNLKTEPRNKIFSPKKIQTPTYLSKNTSKMLSPLKLKTPNINFDLNIANSLLFSPNQLLSPEYLPVLDQSKSSIKKNGIVKSYAANTHQGLVRNYNEDRVAIILNIMKPPNKKDVEWPLCSYFAIYDGHGGTKCAEFLRDNLHHYVVKDSNFPNNPKLAIKKGFQLAEKSFLDSVQSKNGILDKSGSCAIVVLIVDDMCYVANVGDSRAVLSQEKGNKIIPLSKDHKPDQEEEKQRILSAGGQVYQSQSQTIQTQSNSGATSRIIQGPFRVLPGRLSVSRTFGDAEAKLKAYGGNPNVIIAEPDIKSFKITEEIDFIMLGCDGIFDRLTNKDALKAIWETKSSSKFKNIHEFCARAVENLMKESLMHKTLDNITSVMIGFKNLKETLFGNQQKQKSNENIQNVDKNGNLIIESLNMIEYKYTPDNPNEASFDEILTEHNKINNNENGKPNYQAQKYNKK